MLGGMPQAVAEEQDTSNIVFAETQPDIVALRYFSQTGQRDRFNKELARLQKTFPNFNPTYESFLKNEEVDEKLWTLFGEQQLEQLENEIAKLKETTPYWKPSEEMLEQLRIAKIRVEFTQAYDRNDFNRIIELAGSSPELLNENNLTVVWMAGEALAREKQNDAAFEMFEFGVNIGRSSPQLPILIQKASRYLAFSETSRFVRQLKIDEMDDSRANQILERHLRGVVLRSADQIIAFPPNLEKDVEQFGVDALAKNRFDDVELLGWTFFGLNDFDKASRWFDALPPQIVEPKLLQGKILSLRNSENLTQALYLANRWKDSSREIAAMYINLNAPIVSSPQSGQLEDELIADFQRISTKYKIAEGAEALGWYQVNTGDVIGETNWFTQAALWRGENTNSPSIIEGRILTLKNTNRLDEARKLAAEWRTNSPEFARLYVDLHIADLLASDDGSLSPEFLSTFEEATELSKSASGSEALGWYNLTRAQDVTANKWFDMSVDWRNAELPENAKIYEGKIIALKRSGNLKQARILANRWREKTPEIANLYIDLNAAILLNPKVKKQEKDFIDAYVEITERYRSEQGAEALGWYLVNTGQSKFASQWFDKALQWKNNGDRADATKLIEGRIIAARQGGRIKEARRLASKNAHLSRSIAQQYVGLYSKSLSKNRGPKRSKNFINQYGDVTKRYKFAEGAEALAWYAHNRNRFKTADIWFDRALVWNETETAAFGKTLNASKRKLRKRFATLKKRYAKRYKSVAKLQYPTATKKAKKTKVAAAKKPKISRYDQLATAMVNANRKGQYKKCAQLGGQLAKAGLARGKDYELRGWCQINRKQFKSASASFSRAIKLGGINKSNARYGLGLAALNTGQLKQAASIAKTLPKKRKNDILKNILTRQALNAYENRRYKQTIAILDELKKYGREPRGMSEIRGWSLLKRRKTKSAIAVFKRLDNQVSTRKSRKALAIARNQLFSHLES